MRDLKYRQAAGTLDSWRAQVNAIASTRSPELYSIGKAFATNLTRISHLTVMPMEIAHRAKRDQKLEDFAALKIDLEAIPHLSSEAENIEELQSKAVSYVEELLKSSIGMQQSMEALLASFITSSWTAFEVLAGDLWVEGVNSGPADIVARLHLASDKLFDRPEDNIRPETVHELGINAKTHFGSFLRAIGRVSFQKLHKIKGFYEAAFGVGAAKLFDETEGGYIYALSAVRNVLTHSSGKADRNFLKQGQRFPELRDIVLGDEVLIDGALVIKLRTVAAVLGAALLHCVDDFITPPQADVANTTNLET